MSSTMESNNSTSVNASYLIPFCNGSSQACLAEAWQENMLTCVNLLSLVANPIHIYTLTRFKEKLETTYMKILILITIWDILVAATSILQFNCQIRQSAANSYAVSILALSIYDSVSYIRFIILSLAFFDRWLAVAHPFKYKNIIAEYFRLLVAIPIIIIVVMTLLRNLIFREDICIDSVSGVTNCVTQRTKMMTCSTLYTLSFVFDAVFLSLLLRELRKMRQKLSLTTEDKELRNATKTVIVITLLYFGCFMWQPMIAIASGSPAVTWRIQHYCMYVTYVLYSLYGLMNIAVYGLLNKSYRDEMRRILLRSNRRVTPT